MSINLINYALAKKDWKKFYEDLEVLGVGGRNLLKSSRLIRPFSNNISNYPISYSLITEGERQFYRIVRTNTQSYPTLMSLYNNIPITNITQDLQGQTVTFSFRARSSHNVSSTLSFRFDGGSNGTKNLPYNGSTIQITTSWKTFAFTVDIDFSIYNSDFLRLIPSVITIPSGEIDNFYLDLCEFKIELGNKATDWTPAPDDIDAHPFVAELAETVFRSKQQDWEKAYEDFKVLGVGGRNLVGNFNLYPWGYGFDTIDDFGNTLSYVVKLERYTNYIAHRKTADYNNRFRFIFVDKDTDDPEDLIGESGTVRFSDDNALSYSFNSENYNWLVIYLTNQKNVDDVEKAFVKLEKGNKATDWTPAPEDINAHPFVAELAETVYRSKQNEERIRNLENAITALGGGS